MHNERYLDIDWPLPRTVRATCTTRLNGFSTDAYQSFNLATHVGDDTRNVLRNREQLQHDLQLPTTPNWLTQVHGTEVVEIDRCADNPEADACIAREPGKVCAVLTADCLPLLLSHREGLEVAAIHAGWRGLLNGVIDATVTALSHPVEEYIAWLGPALGPEKFEVDHQIRLDFIARNSDNGTGFKQLQAEKYLLNMYTIARMNLARCGIQDIYGGGLCTYSDDRFFSYRQDNGTTGRMATLVYITN